LRYNKRRNNILSIYLTTTTRKRRQPSIPAKTETLTNSQNRSFAQSKDPNLENQIMRSVEVAKTVLEVADVAWTAVEHTHHYRRHSHSVPPAAESTDECPSDHDLEALRSENRRLRNLLDQNLKLLQNLSESPCFDNCPPDVYFKFQ